jgi:effector-binding domain-containing protein
MTSPNVTIQTVPARKLAAVRRNVKIDSVGTVWRPALDEVWTFLRAHAGLHTDGHNVFVYHHPASRDAPMDVDFGVEVIRAFEREGDVFPAETPAGEVATALHVGGYDQLRRTHDAIHAWRTRQRRSFAGTSWEIYGDWSDDPSKLETTVCYLLG